MTGWVADCVRGGDRAAGESNPPGADAVNDAGMRVMRGARVSLNGDSVRIFGEWRGDNATLMRSDLSLVTDAPLELVLARGWQEWGRELADKLRGPFALVIADQGQNVTYCARDAFGVAPFFHAVTARCFVASNRSRSIRDRLDIAPPVNGTMIADFLAGETIEKEKTYFQGIVRLPPGCWMEVDEREIITHRYWDPRTIEPDENPDHAAEKFRELFDRSTAACHLAGRSGLLLSGGLDSSSIAGSLATSGLTKPEFPVFSLTYRQDEGWSDGRHLDRLCADFGFTRHELASENHDPLSGLQDHLRVLDGPYLSYGHSLSFRLQPFAREAGCDVVLCGHGGDEIVSYGFGRLNELARQGRWLTLWREADGAGAIHGKSRAATFKPFLRQMEWYRQLAAYKMKLMPGSTENTKIRQLPNILSDALADNIDSERYRTTNPMSRRDHDDRMVQSWALDQPIQVKSLEVYAICSESDGVRTAMPFYDRDLAEHSLSLPSQYKLNKGVTRSILRSAMADTLPASVLNRQDKFNFAGHFIRGMAENRGRTLDLTDPAQPELAPYVNAAHVNTLRDRLSRDRTQMQILDAFALWRVAVLAMWLKDSA